MLETLKALFDPKKSNFFVKNIEVKNWGNLVVVHFVQSQGRPENGSNLIIQFNHCYEIIWEFYAEEYVNDNLADVIAMEIHPQDESAIKLVLHCNLFELIIHFRDFEVI